MRERSPRLRRIWRRWRGYLSIFGASLALALVIWFAITDSENELIEQQFGFSLAVAQRSVPADLVTANRIPPVSITIAGRENDIDALSVGDFSASIDLGGLAVGVFDVPVQVVSRNDDVRVRAVTPATVEVVLERLEQRTLPVVVVISDPEPIGFERGEPVVVPANVVISGTANLIDLVDVVVAPVDLSSTTVDVDRPVTLQARTNTGAAVSGIRIEPPTVDVSVAISRELFPRAAAVVPDLIGVPAVGFRVAGITVAPLTVVLVGTLDGLENAGPATTTPISLAGRESDLVATVSVLAPEGLTLEADATVTVRIEIQPVIGQIVFDVPVEIIGLSDSLTALVSPLTVEMVIEGPAPLLAELTTADVPVT
ncbi:MAG: CdaR family protein, partial [Chloroflexi bacterium]|nr:CdaR family protein [Chloroflexota bacterium]